MKTILVTRPKHQQQPFIHRCEELGLTALPLPLLDIKAVKTHNETWQHTLTLPNTAWIFTSKNAVLHSPFNDEPRGPVFAMGASTARALEANGRTLHAEPEVPFNSEALVNQLKSVNANSAVVVTGIGGRAYLANELRSMGWDLDIIECYERIPVSHAADTVTEALNKADILSLTSIESMDALIGQAHHVALDWKSKPVIVNSQRAVTAARQAGFTADVHVAVPAGDDGQISVIKQLIA